MSDVRYNLRRFASRVFLLPLAKWLDGRNPRWCWADLCTDLGLAYRLRGWSERAKKRGPRCEADARESGTCWCGKMRCAAAMERCGFPAADVAEQRAKEAANG